MLQTRMSNLGQSVKELIKARHTRLMILDTDILHAVWSWLWPPVAITKGITMKKLMNPLRTKQLLNTMITAAGDLNIKKLLTIFFADTFIISMKEC